MDKIIQKNKQLKIEVCYGPECSDYGSRELAAELKAMGLTTIMGDCRSQCPNAPLVLVAKQGIVDATVEKVLAKIEQVQQET